MNINETTPTIHIMMFPFLAFGHISPFLQLARKISIVDPSARITILTSPANVPRITSLLPQTSSTNITIYPLPLPKIAGLPDGVGSTAELSPAQAELIKLAVDGTKPQVQSILTQLKPDCILFDFAQPWIPSIAAPLGIKTFFFNVYAAISIAYTIVPSRCNVGPTPAVDDLKKPPAGFPPTSSVSGGIPTYQATDVSYAFKKFNQGPNFFDRMSAGLRCCSAIIVKSCLEMEGQYISYLESEYKKPILLAGPVVSEPPSGELDRKWADWLGRFDRGSVVFCSFGSETFLNEIQESVRELLLGLELAGMPFLVVLNFLGGEEEMKNKLPSGFKERVKGRGVVHCGWVQQQLILRHESVGCFVCHAGFSSVVEGLVAGCKLVFLPQKTDQFFNSALFAGDLGIGVEVEREDESGGFGREAVFESAKKVMADVEVGGKHGKWREFLMDKKMEEGFMEEFVRGIKAIITDN